MKWKLVLITIFTLILTEGKSQNGVSPEVDTDVYLINDSTTYFSDANFLGTFQIIHRSKEREVFTKDIYYKIEEHRSNSDVVMWNFSPMTTIRIFPRNLIYPPTNYRITIYETVEIIE